MSAIDDRPFPRGALIGAGALVLCSLTLVGAARLEVMMSPEARVAAEIAALPEGEPVAARTFRLEARDDGSVAAVPVAADGASAGPARLIGPEEGGFIHGSLRGMARTRHMRGLDAAPVLTITRWSNGRISVEDRAAGTHFDVAAFGRTNAAAFAALLDGAPMPATPAPPGMAPRGATP